MLDALFPRTLDNAYRGSIVALVLFVPVLLFKTLIGINIGGLNPFVSAAEILQTVDGIPLDTFTLEARTAVLESATAWGVAMVSLCAGLWLAVIRYRAALPLAILLLLLEQVLRTGSAIPSAIGKLAGGEAIAAGGIINLALTGVLAAALVAALLPVRPRPA